MLYIETSSTWVPEQNKAWKSASMPAELKQKHTFVVVLSHSDVLGLLVTVAKVNTSYFILSKIPLIQQFCS